MEPGPGSGPGIDSGLQAWIEEQKADYEAAIAPRPPPPLSRWARLRVACTPKFARYGLDPAFFTEGLVIGPPSLPEPIAIDSSSVFVQCTLSCYE